MRALPVYQAPPRLLIEGVEGRPLEKGTCARCELYKRAHSVCIPADGTPGGLLVIGESPGRQEDAAGRPFVGQTGALLRRKVAAAWSGPVVYDNAVRCLPTGKDGIPSAAVEACRPFLAATIREATPSRIVVLGAHAAASVLGRKLPPISSRRAFAYLDGVPVFFLLHPAAGLRNRFLLKWFEEDLAWALQANPPAVDPGGLVFVVRTLHESKAAIRTLRRANLPAAFDIETAGARFDPSWRVVSLAACPVGWNDAFLWGPEACASPEVRAPLVDWLADEQAKKGGHNVQFDMVGVFAAWGVMPRGVVFDTRLERKLLEPDADGRLAACAELVGMGGHKEEAEEALDAAIAVVRRALRAEVTPPKKPVPSLDDLGIDPALQAHIRNPNFEPRSWAYGLLPRPVLARYNGRDTIVTGKLYPYLRGRLRDWPTLERVRDRLVIPAVNAIAQVEAWGVPVNKSAIEAFDAYLTVRVDELTAKLQGFDPAINWGSPVQVAAYFFDREGLAPVKKTPSGAPSTDDEVLTALASKHPAAAALLEFRKVDKLRGTYARGMLSHVRADERIHCSILLDGARSGRTSASDPNLQNIPRTETIEGKMARDIFAARPGYVLVSLDYSQLELRIAAMLSRDPLMASIFRSGEDYHLRTAKMIAPLVWRIAPDQVEKKHRTEAKSVNFGMLYGKTVGSFAAEFGCSRAEAQKIIDAILGNFVGLAKWCKDRLQETRATGLAWTELDGERARVRHLYRVADAEDDDAGGRITAENGAVNSPVQGTASDLCVDSLVKSVAWLQATNYPARLVLPIHDALLFECKEGAVDDLVHEVGRIMTDRETGGVPLVVDAEVGPSWGSLEKYKIAA